MRPDDTVIVAPDVGRARWADKYGELLGRPIALMHKRRGQTARSKSPTSGDVRGLRPIVVDESSPAAASSASCDALVEAGARPEITLAIIHGVLVGGAEQLATPNVREVIVTNTVSRCRSKQMDGKLTVLSVAPLLAEAIRRTHEDKSVSPMFQVM